MIEESVLFSGDAGIIVPLMFLLLVLVAMSGGTGGSYHIAR